MPQLSTIQRVKDVMYRDGFSHIHATMKTDDNEQLRIIADNSAMTVDNYYLVLPYELRFLVNKLYQENPQGIYDGNLSLIISDDNHSCNVILTDLEDIRTKSIENSVNGGKDKGLDNLEAVSSVDIDSVDLDVFQK